LAGPWILTAPGCPEDARFSDSAATDQRCLQEAIMSTAYTENRTGLAITDLFLSIFGPVLAAGIALFIAVLLNIL
jgi:hypothetical protein